MDIILPADTRSVSKHRRRTLNGSYQPFLTLGLRSRRFRRKKFIEHLRCPVPGPKILRSDCFARNVSQVRVDVLGIDGVMFTGISLELEQFLARHVLAAPYNFCQLRVAQI